MYSGQSVERLQSVGEMVDDAVYGLRRWGFEHPYPMRRLAQEMFETGELYRNYVQEHQEQEEGEADGK